MVRAGESSKLRRCRWCTDDPIYLAYHDLEWGVPVFDEFKLFEMLVLEGAQAGLSWLTILKKREAYRRALEGFDFTRVALFDEARIESLLRDKAIVRNRLKILSLVQNARAAMRIKERTGSFSEFLWGFVDGRPLQNRWASHEQIPSFSAQSISMARQLKALGFTFVGPVICYSFMQAVGMVNDHELGCFRHEQIRSLGLRQKQD
ncbi:MAG: DNA-3-methyladenine glycosylase I [bacterium]